LTIWRIRKIHIGNYAHPFPVVPSHSSAQTITE
jgi:hypothetical protein